MTSLIKPLVSTIWFHGKVFLNAGALPKFVLIEHLQTVVQSLIDCTKVTESTQKWAEARRDAVIGLTEVSQTIGIMNGVEKYIGEIVETLLDCLQEYTVDMRGDIGAWVREASMTGKFLVRFLLYNSNNNLFIRQHEP